MKGDIAVNITIKAGSDSLNIPVIPSKVSLLFGNSTPKTVDIWQLGEVDFNNGKELDGLGLFSRPVMILPIAGLVISLRLQRTGINWKAGRKPEQSCRLSVQRMTLTEV